MAVGRPHKTGLDYLSIYTKIESDPRIEQLLAEHPDKGYEIYMRILTRITSEQGYFMEWPERVSRKVAGKCAVTHEKIQNVLATCLRENLFNPTLYTRFGILTSTELQDEFLRGSARRTKILIIKDFALFTPEYITKYRLSRKAYYCIFENIDSAFSSDGLIISEWQRSCKMELIQAAGTDEDNPQQSGDEPAQHQGNGRPPTGKADPTLNWEKEKELIRSDHEWKESACISFQIGSYDNKKFKPDMARMDEWLEEFLNWCVTKEKQQRAPQLKQYFTLWYPKRQQHLANEPKDKRKSALHTGKQDYDSQTTW